MRNTKHHWFNQEFPQNFIIKKPNIGAVICFIITFGFLMLYRPLNPNDEKIVKYEYAMASYCFLASLYFFIAIRLLKTLTFFSNQKKWTFIKEITTILILLFGMGFVVYFSGFIIEKGIPRFFIAFRDSFLIGIVPFAIFTVFNIPYLFSRNHIYSVNNQPLTDNKYQEEKISIKSKLKKEELTFSPGQFLYAESEGNYVVFYLLKNGLVKKEIIRNSISDVEQQLADVTHFFKTHRAFIVNMTKVISVKGNTLGYRLKLIETDVEIPVARQNTKDFMKLYKQLTD